MYRSEKIIQDDFRLNEDAVTAEMSTGITRGNIDALEYSLAEPIGYVRDLNEERVTFFDKPLDVMEKELSAQTKMFTSLRHFSIRSTKHRPIKRDVVENAFQRDLDIFRITKNFKRTVRWMIAKGMIPDTRCCPLCSNPMRIINNHAKQKDGLLFKCSRLECRDIKINIREGTIFEFNHMTLMEILRVIFYYFSRGFNAMQAFRDLKEFKIPGLQYQYVYDIYRRIR